MKPAFLLIPIVVVAVLYVLLLSAQSDSNTVTINESDIATATPTRTDADAGDLEQPSAGDVTLDQPAVPVAARPATILRLADGDSFDIVWADEGGTDELRLLGINAPEAGACFARAARDMLQSLALDAPLEVESVERDQFGRILANVWANGVFINATMVETGAALALSDGGRYADLIEDAQEIARLNRSGLWDTCEADPALQLRIAAIEFNAPGQDHLNKNGEWIDIANDGTIVATLTDWSIRDESTRHRFFFPDGFELAAGDEVRIFSGCGDDSSNELYWCDDDPVWNNGGDTGFLVDPDGRFADSLSYSGS